MLENSVLPMGWDSSYETLKSDVSCLQTLLTRRNEKMSKEVGVDRHTTLLLIFFLKLRFFPIKGKKNKQSSVSDADQEISTLGLTDKAGNSVNLVFGILRIPSGWDFSVCIEYDDRLYLSSLSLNKFATFSTFSSFFADKVLPRNSLLLATVRPLLDSHTHRLIAL